MSWIVGKIFGQGGDKDKDKDKQAVDGQGPSDVLADNMAQD